MFRRGMFELLFPDKKIGIYLKISWLRFFNLYPTVWRRMKDKSPLRIQRCGHHRNRERRYQSLLLKGISGPDECGRDDGVRDS